MAEHENSTGQSDDWYTPLAIFQALRLTFSLDPCSPGRNHWVPAATVFTKEDDGLKREWHGLVFMNPPFGGRNGHVPWLVKFFDHGNGVAIVENVAALLSRGMGTVLGDLAEIGYDAEWHCIPASAVGAPHRRDRVWIIADTGGEQHEGSRPPISGEIAAQLPRANSDPNGRARGSQPDGRKEEPQLEASRRHHPQRLCEDAADTSCKLQHWPGDSGPRWWAKSSDSSWWLTEPDVGRVADGIPARVDRLKGLGNAVVPQIPEIIGRAIMNAERNR